MEAQLGVGDIKQNNTVIDDQISTLKKDIEKEMTDGNELQSLMNTGNAR